VADIPGMTWQAIATAELSTIKSIRDEVKKGNPLTSHQLDRLIEHIELRITGMSHE
jgi:hypothetical protein